MSRFELLESRRLFAITATFNPAAAQLAVFGDNVNNTIVISRSAAGTILVNGGAVPVIGGTPTVANTGLIEVFGQGGSDTIALSELNGPLPAALLFGGSGNDTMAGGFGADQLFGQAGNDQLFGKGGFDFLFGGADNDILTGGDGDDQTFGESGNDRIIWNPGDDTDLNEGGDGNDIVEVNGGNGAEVFTVTANGTRVRFDRINPAPFALDIGTTENLVLNANGGDDSLSATGNLAVLIAITADGGAGNDTFLGSNGADVLIGGDGNDLVDGNQGADLALLGADDDVFQWDPGDGSDVVEGQAGHDTMLFNGANIGEIFEFSANGGRLRFTRNIGSIVMDTDDVEQVDLRTLGGADEIVVNNLAGTNVKEINVDLAATGGAGDTLSDNVVLNDTTGDDIVQVFGSAAGVSAVGLPAQVNITGAETIDHLTVNLLAGDDVLVASGLSAGAIGLIGNGGDGNDILIGSAGDDTLNGDAGDDVLLGGPGIDVLDGGTGSNVVIQ